MLIRLAGWPVPPPPLSLAGPARPEGARRLARLANELGRREPGRLGD